MQNKSFHDSLYLLFMMLSWRYVIYLVAVATWRVSHGAWSRPNGVFVVYFGSSVRETSQMLRYRVWAKCRSGNTTTYRLPCCLLMDATQGKRWPQVKTEKLSIISCLCVLLIKHLFIPLACEFNVERKQTLDCPLKVIACWNDSDKLL